MVLVQPPFPRAWIWILLLAALAVGAFFPRYFAVLSTADWRLHVHAATAMAWMFLVAIQSRLIHSRGPATHRRIGLSSLVLAPLFLVGGMLVIQTQGNDKGPIHKLFGPSLVAVDLLGMLLFAFLFAAALATRRRPQLHARYMIGTLFLLIGPIGARLLIGFMPGLTIRSLADISRFGPAVQIANGGFVVLLCAIFYARAPRDGFPFLLIGGVAIVQSVLFEALKGVTAWAEVTLAMSQFPAPVFVTAGLALGIAAVALGWRRSGLPPAKSPKPSFDRDR